jgi:hypothetical protein
MGREWPLKNAREANITKFLGYSVLARRMSPKERKHPKGSLRVVLSEAARLSSQIRTNRAIERIKHFAPIVEAVCFSGDERIQPSFHDEVSF